MLSRAHTQPFAYERNSALVYSSIASAIRDKMISCINLSYFNIQVLAGIGLVFFIVTFMVLHFGFVMKSVLINLPLTRTLRSLSMGLFLSLFSPSLYVSPQLLSTRYRIQHFF